MSAGAGTPREVTDARTHIFASLAYRDFSYLWLGQITHAGALWMEMVARPMLILELTGSPVHLGLVMGVRAIPAVGFGALAGVFADSFNRRTVLLTTKAVVFSFSAIFAVVLLMGWVELWHIYLFTFLRGATMAFDQPARRAMIPSIVPRHLVLNAMALSTGSMQLMRIVGAAGAGVLIAVAGVEAPFLAITVFYAGAVFLTWMLRTPEHEREGYRGVRSMGGDLFQGFRFAWNEPAVRGIIIISLGYFTFGMAFMQVFAPLFAKQVLDIGDSGFGYMMAIMGAGGVVGALLLASLSPRRRRGMLTIGMLALLGLLLIFFAASSYLGSVVLVFLAVALIGLGQSAFMPLTHAVLLEAAPENLRGRVLGLLSLDRAMTTVGGAAAGFLAAAIGPQLAQILFGLGCIASALAMLSFYSPLRRID